MSVTQWLCYRFYKRPQSLSLWGYRPYERNENDHNGFYKAKLAVMNISSVEKTAFAVNELIQPNAVILSHANEAATSGGKVNPGTRTRQFIDLVKDRSVHVPLSGKTIEFDENAKCVAGCEEIGRP